MNISFISLFKHRNNLVPLVLMSLLGIYFAQPAKSRNVMPILKDCLKGSTGWGSGISKMRPCLCEAVTNLLLGCNHFRSIVMDDTLVHDGKEVIQVLNI